MKFKIQIKSIAKSSAGRTIFQWLPHQLKPFAHPRINLSPFTKDFRVRGAQFEHYPILTSLSFLHGSINWPKGNNWTDVFEASKTLPADDTSPHLQCSGQPHLQMHFKHEPHTYF